MTEVKVCGITRPEDAEAAEAAGADAVGFVFAPSPRRVEPAQARQACRGLGAGVARVGVFVDAPAAWVRRVAEEAGLDVVQLHGGESRAYAESLGLPYLKAFRGRDEGVLESIRSFGAEGFLLDAYDARRAGGTGARVDEGLARRAAGLGRMVLAGGLAPANVAGAVRRIRPAAVDVSSGVESGPGRKDGRALRAFVEEVRRCDRTSGGISERTEGGLFRRRALRR